MSSFLVTNPIPRASLLDNLTILYLRCFQALPPPTSDRHVSRIFHRSPEIEVPLLE